MNHDHVADTVQAMAEMFGKTFTKAAANMYVDDLLAYPPDRVIAALTKLRRTVRYFPTVAEVIATIQAEDGRPGVEEAWGMCPKSEADSVVWNDEISKAYFVALPLLEMGDKVAARQAFKEKYEALVREARDLAKPVKWWTTQGTDPLGRQAAVMDAVEKGRLSIHDARETVPEIDYKPKETLQIAGPEQELIDPKEALSLIAETMKKLGDV